MSLGYCNAHLMLVDSERALPAAFKPQWCHLIIPTALCCLPSMSRGVASKTTKLSVFPPPIIGVTGGEMKTLGKAKVKSEEKYKKIMPCNVSTVINVSVSLRLTIQHTT